MSHAALGVKYGSCLKTCQFLLSNKAKSGLWQTHAYLSGCKLNYINKHMSYL